MGRTWAWGAVGGIASAVGQHVSGLFRDAGITKANTLVRDAMLNPELAQALLKVTPSAKISGRDWATLRNALARNAVFSTMARDRGKAYAKGGAVKPNHEHLVKQLIDLAEEAKRAEKERTKPILNVADNIVTLALAKAQEAI